MTPRLRPWMILVVCASGCGGDAKKVPDQGIEANQPDASPDGSGGPVAATAVEPAGDGLSGAIGRRERIEELIAQLDADIDALPATPPNERYQASRRKIQAIQALARIGPDATPAVPSLVRELEGSNAMNAAEVLTALSEIGPGAAEAVPALIAKLEADGVSSGFGEATVVSTLGRIGPAAEEAIPILLSHLEENPYDSDGVLLALARIGPDDDRVIDAMIASLENVFSVEEEHLAAFSALGASAIPALARVLEDEEATRQLRPEAIALIVGALGAQGPRAELALPVIVRVAIEKRRDSSEDLPRAVTRAVRAIAPEGIDAGVEGIGALVDLATSGAIGTHPMSMGYGNSGPEASAKMLRTLDAAGAAVPRLSELLRERIDPEYEGDAAREVGSLTEVIPMLGPGASGVLPALLEVSEAISKPELAGRFEVSFGLSNIVPNLAEAIASLRPDVVPGLTTAIREGNSARRMLAAWGIAAAFRDELDPDRLAFGENPETLPDPIEPEAIEPAIAALQAGLGDSDAQVRAAVGDALGVTAAYCLIRSREPEAVREDGFAMMGGMGMGMMPFDELPIPVDAELSGMGLIDASPAPEAIERGKREEETRLAFEPLFEQAWQGVLDAMGDEDRRVRESAARAMAGLGLAEAFELFVEVENHPEQELLDRLMRALPGANASLQDGVALALRSFQRKFKRRRHDAVVLGSPSLPPGESGPSAPESSKEARPILPVLAAGLRDAEPAVRAACASALIEHSYKIDRVRAWEALAIALGGNGRLSWQDLADRRGGEPSPPLREMIERDRAQRERTEENEQQREQMMAEIEAREQAMRDQTAPDGQPGFIPPPPTTGGMQEHDEGMIGEIAVGGLAMGAQPAPDGRPGPVTLADVLPVLTRLLDDPEAAVRIPSAVVLASEGEEPGRSVATLREALDADAPSVRLDAARWLAVINNRPEIDDLPVEAMLPILERALNASSFDPRFEACITLAALGKASAPASDRLVVLASNPDLDPVLRVAALTALLPVGDRVDGLSDMLGTMIRDDEEALSEVARGALFAIGDDPEADVALLVRLLETASETGQFRLLEALQRYGAFAAPATPTLISLLDHPSVTLRRRAMRTLGLIGPGASEAVPALVDLLGDEDDSIRDLSAQVLAMIDPEGRSLLSAHLSRLDARDAEARREAGARLGELGPKAFDALGPLLEKVREAEDNGERGAYSSAIIAIAEGQAGAVPLLAGMLDEDDSQLRSTAIRALAGIGPAASGEAGRLIGALTAPERRVQRAAIEAFRELGPEAAPPLIDALDDEDEAVRLAALQALAHYAVPRPKLDQFGNQDTAYNFGMDEENRRRRAKDGAAQAEQLLGDRVDEAVDAVIALLTDPSPQIRSQASRTLSSFGPLAESRSDEIMGLLSEALAEAEAGQRMALLNTMASFGPAVVPALPEILRSGDVGGGIGAEPPLARIFEPALSGTGAEALPALLEGLEADDLSTRINAAVLVRILGPDAAPAVPGLIELLGEDDPKTRLAASQALGAIGPAAEAALEPLIRLILGTDPQQFESWPSFVSLAVDQILGLPREFSQKSPLLPRFAMGGQAGTIHALGLRGPRMAPILIESLRDEEREVRIAATDSLTRIGMEQEALLPGGIPPFAGGRVMLPQGQVDYDPELAEDVVPAMVEALEREEDHVVRSELALAVARVGAEDERVLPMLRRYLDELRDFKPDQRDMLMSRNRPGQSIQAAIEILESPAP